MEWYNLNERTKMLNIGQLVEIVNYLHDCDNSEHVVGTDFVFVHCT